MFKWKKTKTKKPQKTKTPFFFKYTPVPQTKALFASHKGQKWHSFIAYRKDNWIWCMLMNTEQE